MKYCPECGASLTKYMSPVHEQAEPAPRKGYSQDEIWKSILEEAELVPTPPPAEALAESVLPQEAVTYPLRSTIHILFDRSVTPSGGIIQQAVLSEGKMRVDERILAGHGYIIEDGKVALHDGVPMGIFCQVLEYWAGERQHRRWHMSEPVSFSPSRNSSPYFMDERMVAFGVVWSDDVKIKEAITELLFLCENFGTKMIGKAVVVRMTDH